VCYSLALLRLPTPTTTEPLLLRGLSGCGAPAPTAASAASAGPDASGKYLLREGEDVRPEVCADISSKTAADGDPVAFVLDDDMKVGEWLWRRLEPKAFGEVTNAKKVRMMGRRAN